MTKQKRPNNQNYDKLWFGWSVVYVLFLAALLVAVLCTATSCGTIRDVVKTETIIERHDSIAWRDSIIRYQIPLEKNQAITEVGDTSRLKTSLAESMAWVDSVGRLHHTLEHRKGTIDIPVAIPSRTIWVNTTTKTEELREKIVHVEKPLTWWQNARLRAFWWLAGSLILCLCWIFRKQILAIVKIL